MAAAKKKTKAPAEARYLNRELSWLVFNARVLEEGLDPEIPLLDRLKFLAIVASNLDEFFMVRVGGLKLLAARNPRHRDFAGLSPTQQLDAIRERAAELVERQYACYRDDLEPLLAEAGIRRRRAADLVSGQRAYAERFMEDEVLSVLTPMAMEEGPPMAMLSGKRLHLGVRLKGKEADSPIRHVVIPISPALSRFITLPSSQDFEYILIEDLIAEFIHLFFPGEKVLECVAFRPTRNADMSVREDMAADLLSHMKEVLDARDISDCVRLELHASATQTMTRFLRQLLGVRERDIYRLDGPLDLSAMMKIAGLGGYDALRQEPWRPMMPVETPEGANMFALIERSPILLYHPYDAFEPVLRLLQQAADDPDVLAIKQILYRTSRDSQIVKALRRAAENGKHVTALVELKARFDEARNIDRARDLEHAGVQVVYGVKGYKTHAKLCMVVRREPSGIARYLHLGTGNYNEITAGLYSDVSYLVKDPILGQDAAMFFNAITGYSQPQNYEKLAAAPTGLRDRLLQSIDAEIEFARHGQPARIWAKVNSLADPALIDKLYEASQAGVKIELNIRGICCLRPGVPGLSENIRVLIIIDRYLEHARIVYFHHGGESRLFISSADWMIRNLDRRIELLVPVESAECRRRLTHILKTHFADTVKGRELQPDGTYRLPKAKKGRRVQSQLKLYEEAVTAFRKARQLETTVFEPHLPPKAG